MKNILIFALLFLCVIFYSSEKKNELNAGSSASYGFVIKANPELKNNYSETSLNSLIKKTSFKFQMTEGRKFLALGTALLAAGGTILPTGIGAIVLSYYFAWVSLTWMLETTDFSVKDWSRVWELMFFTTGMYSQSLLAVLILAAGISLVVLGFMFAPGIVFLAYGVYMRNGEKKYSKVIVSPLPDAYGISVRF